MSKKQAHDDFDDSLQGVDPHFEPWEQSRPIPLLVLAFILALSLWGVFTYVGDLATERTTVAVGTVNDVPLVSTTVSGPGFGPEVIRLGNAQVWACANCHGEAALGSGSTPALAGLAEGYVAKQLHDFQEVTRIDDTMVYVAQNLTSDDIEMVAFFYSALDMVTDKTPLNISGSMERGKALTMVGDWKNDIPSCSSCHGLNLEGVDEIFPRLAGQQSEYIISQLAAWKGGSRINSPQSLMDDISGRMDEYDMRAVAQFLGAMLMAKKEVAHD